MKRYIFLLFILVLFSCKKDIDIISEILFPETVTLVFPENNSLCTTGIVLSEATSEVIFEWESAENTDGYTVTLVNLETEEISTFESDSNFLPITLLRGAPYSWFVSTTLASNGNTSDSEISSFYNAGPGISAHLPFPATNVFPLKEAQLAATTSITLEWQGSDLDGDIVSYDVYFGEGTPTLIAENVTGTTSEVSNLEPGTTYSWWVLTRDSLGNESFSETFSFEILN